jgi:hypothetical protein
VRERKATEKEIKSLEKRKEREVLFSPNATAAKWQQQPRVFFASGVLFSKMHVHGLGNH